MKRRALAVGPVILVLACGGKAVVSEPDNGNPGGSVPVTTGGSSGGQIGGSLPVTSSGSGGGQIGGSMPATGVSQSIDASALGTGSDASTASDAGGGSEASVVSEAGSGSDAGAYDGGACGSASVSFGTDIMPIFQSGCTLSSVCHGQMGNAGEEDLYLGDYAGGTSPSVVYQGLVGVPSLEDPSMNLVTSGNLSSSYLWHKVYGDQNSNPAVASGCASAASQCAGCVASAPCGGLQPYLGESLPVADLCAIQNWIGQGAQNN